MREEFKTFVLHILLPNYRDFREEKSAMEVLLDKLSSKGRPSIELLATPKYNCELAGGGIEYSWGVGEYYYRNLALEMKNSKSKIYRKCEIKCDTYINRKCRTIWCKMLNIHHVSLP